MIEPANLPPGVLVKVAQLEANCLGLGARLETARRELQALRVERQNCVPQTVYDEAGVNEESERILGEWARLDADIETAMTRCEALERRLRAEESVVRSCKQFLHELPSNARLRVIESAGGDLDRIQWRIGATRDEIAALQRMAVPSDDLADKVKSYVAALASKAQPIISGVGDGETLSVKFPLTDSADRITQSYFAEAQANPLLLVAWLDGERLAARLLEAALDGSISASERDARLHSLQAELIALRYDEEASISAADDAVRSSSQPAWAVLMVSVETAAQAAA